MTFKYARCWLQGLTALGSHMISQGPLLGTGAAGTVVGLDKERAFLFRWRAGEDSRNLPVYLRKWYHTCGNFGTQYTGMGVNVMDNTTKIPSASRTAMENKVEEMTVLAAGGGGWDLCAKSGRQHEFSTPLSHPYLEHHQMGDQWRGV